MAWIGVVAKNFRYTTPVSAGRALGSGKLRVHKVGNNTSARRKDVVTTRIYLGPWFLPKP